MKIVFSAIVLTTTLASAVWAGPGAPAPAAPAERTASASSTASATAPLMLTEAQLETITAGGGRGQVGDSDPVTALGGKGGIFGDCVTALGAKPAMGSEDGFALHGGKIGAGMD